MDSKDIKGIIYDRPKISVQDLVNFIDKGEKYLQSNPENLTDDSVMDFFQGIVLSPDYQRSYKSSSTEESSIIESILLGIPIPEVFLVNAKKNGLNIRHVMDGQHRLNAIYRYVKNRFPLKNLELLKDNTNYNNKKFLELANEDKYKILGTNLAILQFESFDSSEVETELFKRYNRNTKPLEAQEIEMATYFSETSRYLSKFIKDTLQSKEENNGHVDASLVKIYNITKTRNEKQKNHQELCVICSIIEEGLAENNTDGVMMSKNYLQKKSTLYKSNDDEDIVLLDKYFDDFNKFILKLSELIEYPFSSQIIGDDLQRQNKFLMGISIVLAAIYHYFDIETSDEHFFEDVSSIVKLSPVADPTYKASSTNARYVKEYLFAKGKIHRTQFTALTFKETYKDEIDNYVVQFESKK